MFSKGNKLYSISKGKCPCCHEGDYYLVRNPYNLKKFDKMFERCSVCGQSFQMETGFYYGAMYVSYGLSVTLGIAVFLAMKVIFNVSLEIYMITISAMLIVLVPVVFRLSRIIWINMFVKYQADAAERKAAGKKVIPAISKY
jgi:uncharacterized protein (DUF983 family)